jgi:SAM-dependent methyltransferase
MDEKMYQYPYFQRKEMLDFVPLECKRILEVGCGDGGFSSFLKERAGVEVWGIEIHPGAAAIAGEKLDKVLCGDFVELLKSDLPGNTFDCIVFNDVLEHFLYPAEILTGLKRILVKGGYVVSSIPNFRYIGNLWEIIIDKEFQYKDAGILDVTHMRFYTEKSIVRLHESAGYKVFTCQGINPTRSIKVKLFNLLMLNFFRDIFFMQFATVAQVE